MKKKIKKYQDGSQVGPVPSMSKIKSKTVIKSGNGNYKTVEKRTSGPGGYSDSSKTRRTIKGVLSGAAKPGQLPPTAPAPLINPGPPTPPMKKVPKQPMVKKGGAVKKKK